MQVSNIYLLLSGLFGYLIFFALSSFNRKTLSFLICFSILFLCFMIMFVDWMFPKNMNYFVLISASKQLNFLVIMKLLTNIGNSYLFLYGTELFESSQRGFAIGLVEFLARMILSTYPFVFYIFEYFNFEVILSCLPFAVLAIFGTYMLDETKNKILKN